MANEPDDFDWDGRLISTYAFPRASIELEHLDWHQRSIAEGLRSLTLARYGGEP